jgi:hypothetical protein
VDVVGGIVVVVAVVVVVVVLAGGPNPTVAGPDPQQVRRAPAHTASTTARGERARERDRRCSDRPRLRTEDEAIALDPRRSSARRGAQSGLSVYVVETYVSAQGVPDVSTSLVLIAWWRSFSQAAPGWL